jgi:uncharacterized protein YkwD
MSTLRIFAAVGLPLVAGLAVLAGPAPLSPPAQAQDDPGVRVYMPLVLKRQARPFAAPPTVVPGTATDAPTATPNATNTRTPIPTPSNTPEPTATPTPDEPEWLRYVNHHRSLALLPPVTENEVWSHGDGLHAKYMVMNDYIGHDETASKPYYTAEGKAAAQNGNVAGTSQADMPPTYPIDMWMTGPFHMLGIINPQLLSSGFGDFSQAAPFADGGGPQQFNVQYAATLDVLRGTGPLPAGVKFPVRYPDEGQAIPNLAYEGGESPDPLAACPGYSEPTGPPLALTLGGNAAPKVTKTSFKNAAGTELPHCWFDEVKFKTPAVAQSILARHHSIIVMPKSPLSADAQYTLSITSGGTVHTWRFRGGAERRPSGQAAADRWMH